MIGGLSGLQGLDPGRGGGGAPALIPIVTSSGPASAIVTPIPPSHPSRTIVIGVSGAGEPAALNYAIKINGQRARIFAHTYPAISTYAVYGVLRLPVGDAVRIEFEGGIFLPSTSDWKFQVYVAYGAALPTLTAPGYRHATSTGPAPAVRSKLALCSVIAGPPTNSGQWLGSVVANAVLDCLHASGGSARSMMGRIINPSQESSFGLYSAYSGPQSTAYLVWR